MIELIEMDTLRKCREIHKKYGTSYYFASKFFSKETREAIDVIYAFVRISDEIVDTPENKDPKVIKVKLNEWINDWRETYQTSHGSSVLLAVAKVFKKYQIPYKYSEDFLQAMEMDIEKKNYKDYAELKTYMYGSAAVIGLMLTYVIGFSDRKALRYAESLGYAMQLTNFLRDIKEDYQRGRVYFPQAELKQYGLNIEAELVSADSGGKVSLQFKKFMQGQIARADVYYKEAYKGLKLLDCRGGFAVRVALVLYRQILRKIEQQGYNIFSKRAGTSFLEKIILLAREIVHAS